MAYRCPQCQSNNENYPMLLSNEPRALCAHYSHRRFLHVAFHAQQHVTKAAWCGFGTGAAVVGMLWLILK